MARATIEEVFEIMRASYPRGRDDEVRVHRSRRLVVSRPRPGHLYLVPGAPTDQQMAVISDRAGPAEAALIKINDAYFVLIGVRGFATATVFVPHRDEESSDQAIVEFAWINHTHPMDMATDDSGVRATASPEDVSALEMISRRWGQCESYIVVCRGGRFLRREPVEMRPGAGASACRRRIWTPGP